MFMKGGGPFYAPRERARLSMLRVGPSRLPDLLRQAKDFGYRLEGRGPYKREIPISSEWYTTAPSVAGTVAFEKGGKGDWCIRFSLLHGEVEAGYGLPRWNPPKLGSAWVVAQAGWWPTLAAAQEALAAALREVFPGAGLEVWAAQDRLEREHFDRTGKWLTPPTEKPPEELLLDSEGQRLFRWGRSAGWTMSVTGLGELLAAKDGQEFVWSRATQWLPKGSTEAWGSPIAPWDRR